MDDNSVIVGLGTIVVLGVGMQWLARRVRLPAILLLIAAGLVVGPWLDLVDSDEIFGDSLFPVVSLAVGLLLFEGGLGLDLAELRTHGAKPVVRLITIGVLITGSLLAVVSVPLFGLETGEAAVLGALLVVSGPTVVGPLLKLARPRPPASTVLRWEGIMIDPIGATLALVVLQVVLDDGSPGRGLLGTAGVGIAFGLVGAALIVAALRRFLVPDDLELAVTFMIVVGAYAAAEALQSEAGLFATTALGVALANQRFIQVRRITAFNQDIGIIVLGGLFILLSARTEVDQLAEVLVPSLVLVGFAVLVVRPLVAWVCTAGSGMKPADRAFIGWMGPRGIVAAATSALFGLKLTDAGQDGDKVAAVVFLVIVGTCLVYGLSARPVARRLGVTSPDPSGVLLVGGEPWLLALADRLTEQGVDVTVAASGRYDLVGRTHPWRLLTAPILSDRLDVAFQGIRSAVIASPDDEHNAVALTRCLDDLSRKEVFVLPAHGRTEAVTADSRIGRLRDLVIGGGGRTRKPDGGDEELVEVAPATTWTRRPFGRGVTQQDLQRAFERGATVRTLAIGPDDDGAADAAIGDAALLCLVTRAGHLDLAPRRSTFAAGDTLIVLA
ncbi:MAG: sodium:proton antiporter [Acidimicrobiales bacterium]|jgi:NhaP-type Na+/H+ or K+/H+ antiporter|nr:sodium:proton antiporter [Acidimicrobiales bacterium]